MKFYHGNEKNTVKDLINDQFIRSNLFVPYRGFIYIGPLKRYLIGIASSGNPRFTSLICSGEVANLKFPDTGDANQPNFPKTAWK